MIQLLLTKVTDVYIRENFRRIQQALRDSESQGGSSSTEVTNIVNALSVWKRVNNTVNASTTKVVDQVAITDFSTLEYSVSIRDITNNKTRSFKMLISNENGSLRENVFARLGSGIDYTISTTNNSGTMELTIVNNETVGLRVSMARLALT